VTRARPGERGQATILLIGVLVVVVVIAAALIELGAEGTRRGRLQAVADLTALAAVHASDDGAGVARRNGAAVVSIDRGGDGSVTVVVESDGRRAVASAA